MNLGRESSNTQEAKMQGQDFQMYFKNEINKNKNFKNVKQEKEQK